MKKLCLALFTSATFACGPANEAPAPALPEPESCAEPMGAGTEHAGDISADETWSAEGSPHIVVNDVSVTGGTLTIEPCAVVRFREGRSIVIDGVAGGSATLLARRARFESEAPNTFWGSLWVATNGMLDLDDVVLEHGGSHATAPNRGGTIVASGDNALLRNVRLVNVSILNSEGLGMSLESGAAFTADSRALTIRGAGQVPSPNNVVTDYPISIVPPAVQTLPTGEYTGNAIDRIFVFNALSLTQDEAFKNLGVPYHLGGSFSLSPIETSNTLTLTIEAGVTIEMERGTSFGLGTSNGSLPENIWPVRLLAEGQPGAPIVFTSAEATPVAGDWIGITWAGAPSTGNIMSDVFIRYAGANSGTRGFGCGPSANDAALLITSWRPDADFMDAVQISDSASGGIVSGWSSDLDGPDLKSGNSFINIGNGCDVARWANISAPTCPGDDDVPDCL